MKKYLIRIESDRGNCLFTFIYGDTPSRPFSIARNLWNYATPWAAARRLEILARSWEALGMNVKRTYGRPADMPQKGDFHNVALTLEDFK